MIPWLLKNPALSAALVALVAALAWGGVSRVQLATARADGATAGLAVAQGAAEIANLRADIAEQRETFEREAREAENRQRRALEGVAVEYHQRMTDARATSDGVVADLRAGTERLHDHWQGCVATARLSGAAVAAAGADDGAELRRQGAGDLVRLAAECDAQVSGLQSAIRVMQGTQ